MWISCYFFCSVGHIKDEILISTLVYRINHIPVGLTVPTLKRKHKYTAGSVVITAELGWGSTITVVIYAARNQFRINQGHVSDKDSFFIEAYTPGNPANSFVGSSQKKRQPKLSFYNMHVRYLSRLQNHIFRQFL